MVKAFLPLLYPTGIRDSGWRALMPLLGVLSGVLAAGCNSHNVEIQKNRGGILGENQRQLVRGHLTRVDEEQQMTAEEALTLLNSARTDFEKAYAVEQVTALVDSRFDWNFFWEGLSKSASFSKFSKNQKKRIISLSRFSCDPRAFHSFARFALEEPLAFEAILPPRPCNLALGPELTQAFLRQLVTQYRTEKQKPHDRSQIRETAHLVAYFILEEEGLIQLSPAQWEVILSFPGSSTFWNEISRDIAPDFYASAEAEGIQNSSAKNRSHLYLRLARFHHRVFGRTPFPRDELIALIKDSSRFLSARSYFGLSGLLEFVELLPDQNWVALKSEDLGEFSSMLARFFDEEVDAVLSRSNGSSEPKEQLIRQLWSDFLRISSIFRKIEKLLPFQKVLAKEEEIQNSMLSLMGANPLVATDIIEEINPEIPMAAWMKVLFLNKMNRVDLFVPSDVSISKYWLDRAALHRIRIYLNPDRKRIQEFCRFLEEHGVVKSRLTRHDKNSFFHSSPHSLEGLMSKPGCTRVEISAQDLEEGQRYKFTDPRGKWLVSFNHVLIAPGLDLDLELNSFSGGIFDLSADQIHAPMHLPELSSEYDAIVFPVVIGFVVRSNFDSREVLEYYDLQEGDLNFLLFHFVYKKAEDAPRPKVELMSGFSGGNLSIRVDSPQDSLRPPVVSDGGPGQIFDRDVLKGGKGKGSSFSRNSFIDWFNAFKVYPDSRIKSDIENARLKELRDPWIEAMPSVGDLYRLIFNSRFSEKYRNPVLNSDPLDFPSYPSTFPKDLQVYVPFSFHSRLSQSQREGLLDACLRETGNLEFNEVCAQRIAFLAKEFLLQQLKRYDFGLNTDSAPMIFFDSVEDIAPNGAPYSLRNIDGWGLAETRGEEGEVNFEGFWED